jgi:hypothetical protein
MLKISSLPTAIQCLVGHELLVQKPFQALIGLHGHSSRTSASQSLTCVPERQKMGDEQFAGAAMTRSMPATWPPLGLSILKATVMMWSFELEAHRSTLLFGRIISTVAARMSPQTSQRCYQQYHAPASPSYPHILVDLVISPLLYSHGRHIAW